MESNKKKLQHFYIILLTKLEIRLVLSSSVFIWNPLINNSRKSIFAGLAVDLEVDLAIVVVVQEVRQDLVVGLIVLDHVLVLLNAADLEAMTEIRVLVHEVGLRRPKKMEDLVEIKIKNIE